MKAILIISFAFCAANAWAQTETNKTNSVALSTNAANVNDTALKVIYAEKESAQKMPAYFINGKLASQAVMQTLNPMKIESINVVKNDREVDGIWYYGEVDIKMKGNYHPKLISLTELKKRYTNLNNKPSIFMIDGAITNADYDQYMVDINEILSITIDKVENKKDNIDLGLIKLLTRSEENIKKSKEIRIRANAE